MSNSDGQYDIDLLLDAIGRLDLNPGNEIQPSQSFHVASNNGLSGQSAKFHFKDVETQELVGDIVDRAIEKARSTGVNVELTIDGGRFGPALHESNLSGNGHLLENLASNYLPPPPTPEPIQYSPPQFTDVSFHIPDRPGSFARFLHSAWESFLDAVGVAMVVVVIVSVLAVVFVLVTLIT